MMAGNSASAGQRRRRRCVLALSVCLLAAACGRASPERRRTAPPAERPVLRGQADELAERLEKLEARALRDPELQRMNLALGADLMDGMVAADPRLPRALERVPELEARAAAAQRRGDAAGVREARRELGKISRRFRTAREAALRDRELAGRVTIFNDLLRERMLRTDPAAARLLARYQRVLEQIRQPR